MQILFKSRTEYNVFSVKLCLTLIAFFSKDQKIVSFIHIASSVSIEDDQEETYLILNVQILSVEQILT